MTRRQRDNHKRIRQYRAFPFRWILGAPQSAEAMRDRESRFTQDIYALTGLRIQPWQAPYAIARLALKETP